MKTKPKTKKDVDKLVIDIENELENANAHSLSNFPSELAAAMKFVKCTNDQIYDVLESVGPELSY